MSETSKLESVKKFLRLLQERIIGAFEEIDGGTFQRDPWEYESGGGGISAVLENGVVFEKAGVNYSSIAGESLPAAATASRQALKDRAFTASGVSVICHPLNPYVPTTHLNVRYIEVEDLDGWFGGGFDLTPYYGFEDDAVHWHRTARAACDGFGEHSYRRFKKWCDEYFYLMHRNEPRGIGGLFFDSLKREGFEDCFKFVQRVGEHFLDAYLPIVKRRMNTPYGTREREFQLYRRGRYVEFNLVYDRGTLFGLQSDGRAESILVSLPPRVAWRYNYTPEPGSDEHRLYEEFLKPRDWLDDE